MNYRILLMQKLYGIPMDIISGTLFSITGQQVDDKIRIDLMDNIDDILFEDLQNLIRRRIKSVLEDELNKNLKGE